MILFSFDFKLTGSSFCVAMLKSSLIPFKLHWMSSENVDSIWPFPTFNKADVAIGIKIQTSIISCIKTVTANNHGFVQSYGKLILYELKIDEFLSSLDFKSTYGKW